MHPVSRPSVTSNKLPAISEILLSFSFFRSDDASRCPFLSFLASSISKRFTFSSATISKRSSSFRFFPSCSFPSIASCSNLAPKARSSLPVLPLLSRLIPDFSHLSLSFSLFLSRKVEFNRISATCNFYLVAYLFSFFFHEDKLRRLSLASSPISKCHRMPGLDQFALC